MNYQTAIELAAMAAYEDDADQVVGYMPDSGWTWRHIEDNECFKMTKTVRVGSDGVLPEWQEQHQANLGAQ
ncbi:MAG: hypothetical protein KJN72_12265 [Woeseia sp.]|nr:hypothetical protein [Woeseia sp.]